MNPQRRAQAGLAGYSPLPDFAGQGSSTGGGGAGTQAPAATGGTLPALTAAMGPPPMGGLGGLPGQGFSIGMPMGAWGGFANGRIPFSAMRNVYGMYVAPGVADNLMALLGAAQKAGVWSQGDPYATGTYRPFSVQQQLWNDYQAGRRQAPAARPGTSLHGWGEAIDFTMANRALINWLGQNAGRYGFHDYVGGEPWHYSSTGH